MINILTGHIFTFSSLKHTGLVYYRQAVLLNHIVFCPLLALKNTAPSTEGLILSIEIRDKEDTVQEYQKKQVQ